MKKQDNESLIQELTKRLDWYLLEASEEAFDAEEVQTLIKLLDSLKAEQGEKIAEELPAEEALSDFRKYCEQREEEEKILAETEKAEQSSSEENDKKNAKKSEKGGQKKQKHKVLEFIHRHKNGVVAAAVVLAMMIGGSWQVVANADKHGGFFWWMDKSEEGTTMITSPEGMDNLVGNKEAEDYYTIADVPTKYREYVEIPLAISAMREYELKVIKLLKRENTIALYVFFQDINENIMHFEIIMYPQEILRIRESYVGYDFDEEFEKDDIKYEVLEKEEMDGRKNYIVYFYYENVKYAIVGMNNRDLIKEIAKECGKIVAEKQ